MFFVVVSPLPVSGRHRLFLHLFLLLHQTTGRNHYCSQRTPCLISINHLLGGPPPRLFIATRDSWMFLDSNLLFLFILDLRVHCATKNDHESTPKLSNHLYTLSCSPFSMTQYNFETFYSTSFYTPENQHGN